MNEHQDRIVLKKGDIFSTVLQTITIPVNTAGIMGKGLALKFKRQYPDIIFTIFFNDFKKHCVFRFKK